MEEGFSYIPIGKKSFVYLCVTLDLFSRKIIAWTLGKKIDTTLAITTLEKASKVRQPKTSVLFHTDQGLQYTSFEFRKFLENHSVFQSLSKSGYPWNNSVTEAFFSTRSPTCFEYIEGFYNAHRPRGALDRLTLNETENKYFDSH